MHTTFIFIYYIYLYILIACNLYKFMIVHVLDFIVYVSDSICSHCIHSTVHTQSHNQSFTTMASVQLVIYLCIYSIQHILKNWLYLKITFLYVIKPSEKQNSEVCQCNIWQGNIGSVYEQMFFRFLIKMTLLCIEGAQNLLECVADLLNIKAQNIGKFRISSLSS